MEGMQAYGAGKAGGAFDPVTFFQQPQTVLRVVSWLFSVVVLGCITNEGYVNPPDRVEESCIFNGSAAACGYGVLTAALAFISCLAFLALDLHFPHIASVQRRKTAVLADAGLAAFWSFMWFLGFCVLANQWKVTSYEENPLKEGGDAARAAITFSFFSIFTWAVQAFLAYRRYQLGADSALFSLDYTDPSQDAMDGPGGGGASAGDAPFHAAAAGYQRQDY